MQTTSRYRVKRLTFWPINASNLEMHGLVNAFDYYDTARPNLRCTIFYQICSPVNASNSEQHGFCIGM